MLGKIIGGLIGFLGFGPPGAVVGILAGHLFDRGQRHLLYRESPEQRQLIQETFFKTTFTLIGYLAKADGRVSEEEIDQTQQLMGSMGLTADRKREAIALFKTGAAPGFNPDEIVQNFRAVCGHRARLVQILIVYLINTALADGRLDANESSALKRIAAGLNFSSIAFEQLLRMISAQESFSGGHYRQQNRTWQPGRNEIADAFAALGVSANASDAEVKKAYRKLIGEYHPDKLIGQGVPEDMVRVATERSQEIQTAYDLIRKNRKQ